MSEGGGLEFFSPESTEGGVDVAALERLREQLRENQQRAAKDAKKEAKQKKQEYNLGDIIVALLNNQQASGLLKVITKALAADLPALIILQILALRFKSVRKKLNITFGSEEQHQVSQSQVKAGKSLVPNNFSEQSLPLEVAIEIDLWLKYLIAVSREDAVMLLTKISLPDTTTESLYDYDAKPELKNLMSYVVQDYLQSKQVPFNGQNIVVFASKFADSLVDYLEGIVKNQQEAQAKIT